MKLDPNCVRAVLLAVESCDYGQHLSVKLLSDRVPVFTEDDLQYTCLKLKEGGYLQVAVGGSASFPEVMDIGDLTFSGHELLAKIKDDSQWNTVKKGLSSIRNYSISAMSALAEGITAGAITSFLSKKPNP